VEVVVLPEDRGPSIGDLYRFDRFKPPALLWQELEGRFPELLAAR
jgi:hypothetical protein